MGEKGFEDVFLSSDSIFSTFHSYSLPLPSPLAPRSIKWQESLIWGSFGSETILPIPSTPNTTDLDAGPILWGKMEP